MKLTSMVAAAAVMAAGAADAATTVYTSSAAFDAAIARHQTVEDFSGGTPGQFNANGGSFDGVTYTTAGAFVDGLVLTNVYNSFSGLGLGGDQFYGALQFFFPGDSVTVTFAAPVYAVGVFFNVSPDAGDFVLAAAGGVASTDSAAYDLSSFVFAGLVSDNSFTSATFYGAGSYTIPEIITAAAGAAPEPAAWTMMLMGFAGFGAMLRRRRALRGFAAA